MKDNNKVGLTIILVAGSILLLSFVFINNNQNRKFAGVKKEGFAVVELFTSEGCSSCPPADAAVSNLLSKQIKDVYILSYHVDCWNRLGWKDEFSQQKFLARQQEYARHLGLEGVYTPQIVVNGTTQFVGSNESDLNNAVANGINNESSSNLHIAAKKTNNFVVISYNTTGDELQLLNVALILPQLLHQSKGVKMEAELCIT
jgi:hypothetical protein